MSTLIVFYDEEKWRRTRAKSPAGSAKIDEYGEKRKGRDDGGEGLIGDVRRFLYRHQSDADIIFIGGGAGMAPWRHRAPSGDEERIRDRSRAD